MQSTTLNRQGCKMNLKEKIDELMKNQNFPTLKNKEFQEQSMIALDKFGIPKNSEFYEFYSRYFGRTLIHNSETGTEMVDCISPPKLMERVISFAHEVWEVPANYILFSTGEGEGGYLYNILDNTVWDFDLGKRELLGTDKMHHWNSFYEFLVWYLTTD